MLVQLNTSFVTSIDDHGLGAQRGATHVTKAGAAINRIVLQRSEREQGTRSREATAAVTLPPMRRQALSLKSQLTAGTSGRTTAAGCGVG